MGAGSSDWCTGLYCWTSCFKGNLCCVCVCVCEWGGTVVLRVGGNLVSVWRQCAGSLDGACDMQCHMSGSFRSFPALGFRVPAWMAHSEHAH